jgi:hypothetical protein
MPRKRSCLHAKTDVVAAHVRCDTAAIGKEGAMRLFAAGARTGPPVEQVRDAQYAVAARTCN